MWETPNYPKIMVLRRLTLLILCCLLLVSCQPVLVSSASQLEVTIQYDGKEIMPLVPEGSTVETALQIGSIHLGSKDFTIPPLSETISPGMVIQVTRVEDELFEKTITIPFERQTIRNETLQEGEIRLLQEGVNGEKHVTYRSTSLDGVAGEPVEVSSEITKQPIPEIIMVGVLAPIQPVTISGILVYIENGNCWMIEGNTGQRIPLITTGDLDGRVLRISQDYKWLLFTRALPVDSPDINSLWVLRIDNPNNPPVDLQVQNVIHFADFVPNASQTIIYSTVEPREAAPGWQANNDLIMLSFSPDGPAGPPAVKVDVNSGGVYGWWGTQFTWSRDGSHLAYSRPDGIGLIDLPQGVFEELVSINPFETGGDWAWVPPLAWSPLGDLLFYSLLTPSENTQNRVSFDLAALDRVIPLNITMVEGAGLFSNPSPSGIMPDGGYQVGFMQAIDPASNNSGYRLTVMDQDGSNPEVLFPQAGSLGLTSQPVFWSPSFDHGSMLAVVYGGNIWLIDSVSGKAFQATESGLITSIFWR